MIFKGGSTEILFEMPCVPRLVMRPVRSSRKCRCLGRTSKDVSAVVLIWPGPSMGNTFPNGQWMLLPQMMSTNALSKLIPISGFVLKTDPQNVLRSRRDPQTRHTRIWFASVHQMGFRISLQRSIGNQTLEFLSLGRGHLSFFSALARSSPGSACAVG